MTIYTPFENSSNKAAPTRLQMWVCVCPNPPIINSNTKSPCTSVGKKDLRTCENRYSVNWCNWTRSISPIASWKSRLAPTNAMASTSVEKQLRVGDVFPDAVSTCIENTGKAIKVLEHVPCVLFFYPEVNTIHHARELFLNLWLHVLHARLTRK